MSKPLTNESFMELWNRELLPSIKKEIVIQVEEIKSNLKELTERMATIEASQAFVSKKYDELTQGFQTTKKHLNGCDTKIKQQHELITINQESIEDLYYQLDDLQQYSRRECLEISGIPKLPDDKPEQLVTELGALAGVEITHQDISVAHRLPDTKKTKNRIIVKFVRRDKKDELFKNRRKLIKSSGGQLPSLIKAEIRSKERVFINESLTPYRRKLLGKINSFKKENGYKFLWTQNGKILLKEHESSASTYGFTKETEFNTFLDNITKK